MYSNGGNLYAIKGQVTEWLNCMGEFEREWARRKERGEQRGN